MGRRMCSWVWLIVLLCAKEMHTHNDADSRILRINSWDDLHQPTRRAAARPISQFLRGRSARSSPQQQQQPLSNCSEGDPSCARRAAVTKRQVDPLHSCIEAKCSRWNSGNYLDCVYRECVTGFQLHGRRSLAKRDTSAVDDTTAADDASAASHGEQEEGFGEPEGRFLLLPVDVKNHSAHSLPDLLRPDGDEAASSGAADWRARVIRFIRRRASTSDHQQRSRQKRSTANSGPPSTERREPLRQFLSVMHLRPSRLHAVRSYNDIADVCVDHHCGHLQPHTMSYFRCVDDYCTGTGKRL